MTNRTVFYYRNVGSYTADYQVGPFNVDPLVKLYSAKVRGSIVAGFNTTTVIGLKADNDIVWGLQWGAVGYTPLNVLTQINDLHWLRTGNFEIDTVFDNFDNAITSIELGSIIPIRSDWYGQLPMSGSIDFYISVGVPFATGAGSAIDGSLEILGS